VFSINNLLKVLKNGSRAHILLKKYMIFRLFLLTLHPN